MPDSQLSIRNDAEWPTEALRDVCDLITRGRAPAYVESSKTLAIGQRCITDSGFDPSFARPHDQRRMSGMLEPAVGDVLLNSTGTGTIGRSCTFSGNGSFIVDGHVTLIRPQSHKADQRWIESLLRSPWGQAHLEARCFSGSTNQVELSRTELAGTAIPLPPLSEQQRIADALDAVDETIRSSERLIAKLEIIKQGLVDDLLRCGVDPDGQLRDLARHPEECGRTVLGELPRGWAVTTLDETVEVIDCKHYTPTYVAEGIPVVRPRNIKPGGITFDDVEYVSDGDYRILTDKHIPQRGDIVFSRNASFGVSCFIDFDQPFALGQDTIILVAKSSDPGYIHVCLESHLLQKQIQIRSGGSTFGRINLGEIRKLHLPLPSVAEQTSIASIVAAHEERKTLERRYLKGLRLLKAGLVDDLLTGRVRVNTESEDPV